MQNAEVPSVCLLQQAQFGKGATGRPGQAYNANLDSEGERVPETSEAVKKLLTLPERALGYVADRVLGGHEKGRRLGSGVTEAAYKLLTLGTVIFVAFLLGGGSYIAVYRPAFLVAGGGPLGATFIYTGSSLEQTFLEGIFVSTLYVASLAGMYLVYRSTRYSHSPRTMWMIFVLGFFLLAFGCAMIYQASRWKAG
ncbi:MAG: hypothetical protein JTT11_00335 [Candidatus Brockarchaeota archaeon]|nr:hypothetical protein [Candidatus Brockarchaeota archaeon]